jgi:serine/threonine protein kinase/tetratricopeptide (TPR) repeat protein
MTSARTTTLIANRFEIVLNDTNRENFLGQGGMGAVYIGRDTRTDEKVAIKLLKQEFLARDPEMVERFIREGDALRKLNHPNIVKMLGAHEQDGVNYLIMEYVPGGSLRDVLLKKHRLSVQQALYIALDLADALTRAHRLDILHRDIKPDNVLIADDGTPRLTDFGMARLGRSSHLTQDGAVVGTLAYMAPELFQGGDADERTDIWSFGVLMFEMLAGERPYPYEQPGQLINAIIGQNTPFLDAIRNDIPTGLIDLVQRMLAKDRHSRIASVRLVGAELEAIIRGATSTLQAVAAADSTGRFDLTPTPEPIPMGQPAIKHNLPAQPTSFVGREKEINELSALLEDSNNRLITLVAPGGMGKTRLSIATAEKNFKHFKDGVYFVGLACIGGETQILPAIAEALEFTFATTDLKTELAHYLSEKHTLIILDNFEQLTSGSQLIADLLEQAPHLRFMITSRERLRLRSETIYEVPNLPLPNRRERDPQILAETTPGRLFIQSAHRVLPDFAITDDNVEAVNAILRLTAGLPLAIELAAAWLDMLSVDEIKSEIERSLDFLESNLRDVPERHRSIRAVFEYSWNLMTEEERDVFLKLSVFEGGFEREAAQNVANASLRTLTNLINKSLLLREPSGRYLPHRLLRQYAAERFQDHPQRLETRIAHAMYYSRFLDKLRPLYGTSKENAAFDAIEGEIDNLRAAWTCAIEGQKWDALSMAIMAVHPYYMARSMKQEPAEVYKQLIDAMEKAGQQNTALYWMARSSYIQLKASNYEEAFQVYKQAFDFYTTVGDSIRLAYSLNNMSYARMMQGQLREAYDYAAQANELMHDMQDKKAWFTSMGNLGYIAFLMGDLQEAQITYESIIHTAENVEYSPTQIAHYKNNLGEILRELSLNESAKKLFEEAYAVFEAYKNKRGMAFTLNNLGGLVFATGAYEDASKLYQRAYEFNREIGDRSGLGHSLSALGNIAQIQGDTPQAKRYFSESLKMRRDMGDKRGIADSLADLARIAVSEEHGADAIRLANEAMALYQEMGDRLHYAQILGMHSMGNFYSGRIDEARKDVDELSRVAKELNVPFITSLASITQAEVYLHDHRYDDAFESYKTALRLAHTEGAAMTLIPLVGVADIYFRRGDYERALHLVSLVLLYPRNYVAVVEQRAQKLFAKLKEALPAHTVETALLQSRSLVLQKVVAEVLAAK